MGKFNGNAMYNIISTRISDDEKKTLVEMSRFSRKSFSVLIREAVNVYAAQVIKIPRDK